MIVVYLLEVLAMPESCCRIIDQIIQKRHDLGMTQKELATATGLTQSVIGRLEGKKATPQLDTLLRIVDALGCDLKIEPR